MIAKITNPLEHINFQGGWPTPRLHPQQALKESASSVLSEKNTATQLCYGPELGLESFRENVAKWLTTVYRPAAAPISGERIIITNGASNGLSTILQKFSDPKYTLGVWMVEPTYFLACPIFRDAGLAGKIFGVPEGQDSIDLDFLRDGLERLQKSQPAETPSKTKQGGYSKIYRHIIYLIPTFSNPSGRTMSLRTRQGLIRLAREHDALVVSDDVYDVLRWPTDNEAPLDTSVPSTPRLVDVDREMAGASEWGNAVSNGSFAKIIAPGIRVGWLEASSAFAANMGTVGATVSGGCQSHFASLVINQLLESGLLSEHINNVLIPTYRRRWQVMTNSIKQYLYPLSVRILAHAGEASSGGFFLYVTFAGGRGTGPAIAQVALRDYNLKIAPGHIFRVPDDPGSEERGVDSYYNGARLCWAWHEEEQLVEGIRRLAQAIKDVETEAGKSEASSKAGDKA